MADIRDLFEADDDGVVIAVHAQPGAGRSEIQGRHGDAVKIRVAAPPEQGRANLAIGGMLATEFGVKESAVRSISGASSRSKRFRIDGIDADTASTRLEQAIQEGARKGPKSRTGR